MKRIKNLRVSGPVPFGNGRGRMARTFVFVSVGLAAVTALVGPALATPSSNILSAPVVARASFVDPVDVKFKNKNGNQEVFQAPELLETVMQQIIIGPGGSTGWHSHPGPVFISVTQGTLTYYLYDDPTCTPHRVTAPGGFVDDARGHMVRNESGQPARDVSVIIAPTGGAFRGELDAPSPHCGF